MKNVGLIPEIVSSDARAAAAFYQKAFGAKSMAEHATPDGKKVMHSAPRDQRRGDLPRRRLSRVQWRAFPQPESLGGTTVTLHLNCADVQAAWKRAVDAGATVRMPLEKQFWGDVYGIVEDPFGQTWSMSAAAEHEKPEEGSEAYQDGAKKMYPT